MRKPLSSWLALIWTAFSCLSVMAQIPMQTSFGNGGILDWQWDDFSEVRAIDGLSGSGQLLVGGNTGKSINGTFDMDLGLTKLDSLGHFFNDFGQQGKLQMDFPGFSYSSLSKIKALADGSMLILGQGADTTNPQESQTCLMKLDAQGQLATSFGNGGATCWKTLGGQDLAQDMKIAADGSIFVVGTAFDTTGLHQEFPMIAKFQANGQPESSLGGTGKMVLNLNTGMQSAKTLHTNGGSFYTIGLLPDGRLQCGGSYLAGSNYGCLLVRLDPNGALDSSFHNSGILAFDLSPSCNNYIQDLAIQANGGLACSIYLDCWFWQPDFIYLQLPEGDDPSGFLNWDYQQQSSHSHGLLLDSDGRKWLFGGTYAAGSSLISSDGFAICRLSENGQNLDHSFAGQGWAYLPAGNGANALAAAEGPGAVRYFGGQVQWPDGRTGARIIALQSDLSTAAATAITSSQPIFSVWPNPCTERLHISGKGKWQLLDTFGNEQANGKDDAEISVEGLAAGLYWLRGMEGRNAISLVVQH